MRNINEEIERIKQLFTEERLYGNLVDKKIINENVYGIKDVIDSFMLKLGKSIDNVDEAAAKLKLDAIVKKIGDFKNKDDFYKYIDKKGVGGFRNDLDDSLKSYFNVVPNDISRTSDIDVVVDDMVDILMGWSEKIKSGDFNFPPETKKIFDSIEGFEDAVKKFGGKGKNLNIPQLTPASKKELQTIKTNIATKIVDWHKDKALSVWYNFLDLFRKSPNGATKGFLRKYGKLMSSSLWFSPHTLGLGMAKDFIRIYLFCSLTNNPEDIYPSGGNGGDFSTGAKGKLNEFNGSSISLLKEGSDDMEEYNTILSILWNVIKFFIPLVGADPVSLASEWGIIDQRKGLFNWEGYRCGELPDTWFKKFIDEVGDAISEEEAKDLKKGFREGITKYSTELKNNIDNEFSNKTFQTTDGKVITYQDLMNAANGVNANSPE